MFAFARVIVERQDCGWTAYFGDEPQITALELQPYQAMQRLLRTMSDGEFQELYIRQIYETSRDGHLEFLVPFIHLRCGDISNAFAEYFIMRSPLSLNS